MNEFIALGTQLREERQKRGLTQRQLARRAEVTASHICDIELGRKTASAKTYQKIADVLGLRLAISITMSNN